MNLYGFEHYVEDPYEFVCVFRLQMNGPQSLRLKQLRLGVLSHNTKNLVIRGSCSFPVSIIRKGGRGRSEKTATFSKYLSKIVSFLKTALKNRFPI